MSFGHSNSSDNISYHPYYNIYPSVEQVREESEQKAVNNGLLALVPDGMHKLKPRTKRRTLVQTEEDLLYMIHGVCRCDFDVPLLFAVTRHKSEKDYLMIFGKMKEAVEAVQAVTVQAVPSDTPNAETELRITLYLFEAARVVYPLSSIEGGGWHDGT
ncbi:hypothetical protein Aduo_014790 [Ancylostoma duodenale]